MNVFCCLNEDGNLMLGIPPKAEWAIKTTPIEGGSVLTLQIDGTTDILLLGGNPVNLSEQTITVKDFDGLCSEILGPVVHINVTHPSDNINILEGVKQAREKEFFDSKIEEKCDVEIKRPIDKTAFYKWSRILGYLENQYGLATVSAWFDDAVITEFTAKTLKIEAGSDFRREVIQRRCLNDIHKALKELFDSEAKVEVYAGGC